MNSIYPTLATQPPPGRSNLHLRPPTKPSQFTRNSGIRKFQNIPKTTSAWSRTSAGSRSEYRPPKATASSPLSPSISSACPPPLPTPISKRKPQPPRFPILDVFKKIYPLSLTGVSAGIVIDFPTHFRWTTEDRVFGAELVIELRDSDKSLQPKNIHPHKK